MCQVCQYLNRSLYFLGFETTPFMQLHWRNFIPFWLVFNKYVISFDISYVFWICSVELKVISKVNFFMCKIREHMWTSDTPYLIWLLLFLNYLCLFFFFIIPKNRPVLDIWWTLQRNYMNAIGHRQWLLWQTPMYYRRKFKK